jgi:DNA-binding transcriptional regulator YdaS (Cro superfamily)
MKNWKRRITDRRTGLPKRGALSRLSECLGIQYTTLSAWYFTNKALPAGRDEEIEKALKSGVSLRAKKRSDTGKKRGAYKKKSAGAEIISSAPAKEE